MPIEKRPLKEVDKNLLIQLFNDPLVKRHMPLSAEHFAEKEYLAFIAAKEAIWQTQGFGPCAYFCNDELLGWGGIQPDEDDFELALVLAPAYWGYGRQIYQDLIEEAFTQLKLDSVTILFPLSRTRIKWIYKVGFVEEGQVLINNHYFRRFRLQNPHRQ